MDFKKLKIIMLVAVLLAWAIRLVGVPMGYLTMPAMPTPDLPQLEQPIIPNLTRLDIFSFILTVIGIAVVFIPLKKLHELHPSDYVGLTCGAISIYLTLWRATLIGGAIP